MIAKVSCLAYPGTQVDGTFHSHVLLDNIRERIYVSEAFLVIVEGIDNSYWVSLRSRNLVGLSHRSYGCYLQKERMVTTFWVLNIMLRYM